tara:strand:+ start:1554 stop:3068 length:1515 start_codon:yes stop_codon:yes gene_type:complete
MELFSLNQVIFPFLILTFLMSIIGYGSLINNTIFKNEINLDLYNLTFIKGLICVGLICVFINFFISISNLISFIIIFVGLILFLLSFVQNKSKKNKILFLIFVSLLSFFFAFYSGINDDFGYHYQTIKNYKSQNLFEIKHDRMISYNSHWLFLNSIYSISFFTSSIFILSSLLYSITIYDFIKLINSSIKNRYNYLVLLSFSSLIFCLGVLNKMKDFGTDVPGVIVCIYILIIIFYYIFETKNQITNKSFLFILLLCQFALLIKLTNALIFLFCIPILFKVIKQKLSYSTLLVLFLYPIPWLFQNYIISGCLIWPISLTCFSGVDAAIREIYLIESFAKGDITTNMNVDGFGWINVWLSNHSLKILETYIVFFVILLIPFFYILLKEKNIKNILKVIRDKYINFNYLIFFVIIFICNLIWFLYTPAYRFGIFYNFLFIIFIVMPLWFFMLDHKYKFILRYSKFIVIFISIYFIYENLKKVNWYVKRYDLWPPIINERILDQKKF